MNSRVYLVPKLGVGNNKFMSEYYSEEILVCEKKELEVDITEETVTYKNNTKKETYQYYSKGEIIFYLNGYLFDSEKNVASNYFILNTKEEALEKMNEMISLIQEELLKNSKIDILNFIENLRTKIFIKEIKK